MTKLRKFLIVSHGGLARGMKSSVELIAGEVGGLVVLGAYEEENKSIEEELERLFGEGGDERFVGGASGDEGSVGRGMVEWVVFTDLLGGSVTNQVLRAGKDRPVHVVAGVNLPLVVEVVLSDPGTPIEEILEEAVSRAREQLVYVNPLLTQPNNDA
ncbi:MAG: hypothetical protein JST68_04965 [Bacteroidetes bacterium]|nr:hypothetical protein [Bacteroidota bacterium]